jgi:hypothetical protein
MQHHSSNTIGWSFSVHTLNWAMDDEGVKNIIKVCFVLLGSYALEKMASGLF